MQRSRAAMASLGRARKLGALGAAVPLALVGGILAAQGRVDRVLVAIPVAALWWVTLRNWRLGVWGLLAYMPFSGAVALALHPWRGGLLLKDLIFVVPAYFGFLTALALGRTSLRGLPRLPLGLMGGLVALVAAQCFNRGVANWLMAAIGAKVWLFYLPLFVLSFALITSPRELVAVFRLLVVLAAIPCGLGIGEVLLGQILGYQQIMVAIYGGLAGEVTQGFSCFSLGSGALCRIPSTFTFVSQYFAFTLAMLVPAYAVWRGDPSQRWRSVGGGVLFLVAAASFLSGSRSAFLFVPLLLVLVGALDGGLRGVLRGGPIGGTALAVAVAVIGTGFLALHLFVGGLFVRYASNTAYGGLAVALSQTALGEGVGTNTGPARYALADPTSFSAIENYYAKAAHELGVPGVVLVFGLFAMLALQGYKTHRVLSGTRLHSFSAPLAGFLIVIVLNNFKGWIMDIDPVNMYLWVFAGVLFKLPYLEPGWRQLGGWAEAPLRLSCRMGAFGSPKIPRAVAAGLKLGKRQGWRR